jgi:esterase/lipase superfamily enzyme
VFDRDCSDGFLRRLFRRVDRRLPRSVAVLVLMACLPSVSAAAVKVVSATYGQNCGVARGNVTPRLASVCDGKNVCRYIIDYQVLGDPAPGCAKTFVAEWTCSNGGAPRSVTIPGEAGFKSPVVLSCAVPPRAAVAIRPPVAVAPVVVAPQQPARVEAVELHKNNYTVVPVYFATDRNETSESDPALRFGGDRGALTYGTCEVSIPLDHQMGELEAPSWWKLEFRQNPENHVVLLSVTVAEKDQLFAEMSRKVDGSDGKSAFIFVHGYNVTFEDAARRTAQMAYDLNFQGAPIFYSWPSQGRTAAYTVDEQNVEWTQPHLQEFLEDVVARTASQNIYLVAHSMGNRALTRAFAGLTASKPQLAARVKELILTAPDIDADVFKTQIAPQLTALGTPVTLYVSATDKALEMSKTVHGSARAGDAGQDLVILPGMETIDASEVDTSFVGHSYYAESKSVLSDIFYVLRDHQRAQERFGLREVIVPQGRYWAFKQ